MACGSRRPAMSLRQWATAGTEATHLPCRRLTAAGLLLEAYCQRPVRKVVPTELAFSAPRKLYTRVHFRLRNRLSGAFIDIAGRPVVTRA